MWEVVLRVCRLVMERVEMLWKVAGGVGRGTGGQGRALECGGAEGGHEVGEKGCVVCPPGACIRLGQWLEGWM